MTNIDSILVIIPARGGSKRLPGKNIMPLVGKPLIFHTLDVAINIFPIENICVSTEDQKIINLVESYGLKVPFVRPKELATDIATSRDVIIHAIDFYKNKLNRKFSTICLLQPTSPFRSEGQIFKILKQWDETLDMIVSVKKVQQNSNNLLFEESKSGYLNILKNRREKNNSIEVYAFNGAIYLINIKSIMRETILSFEKIKKFLMDEYSSIDIDTKQEFEQCERIFNHKQDKERL